MVTDSGVRVYKRWQDNLIILPGDESDPDLHRKAEECFTQGRAKGLPKIASENSEDALTWSVFSALRRNSPDGKWLLELWAKAFDDPFPAEASADLKEARVAFWRGRQAPLEEGGGLFRPPPDRPEPEGETEVDVVVTVGRALLLFIEAKLHSEVSTATTHDPSRNQIIRNLDVGSWYARRHGFASFALVLLTSHHDPASADAKAIKATRSIDGLRCAMPYRADLKRPDWERLTSAVGWIRWADLWKLTLAKCTIPSIA